MCILYLATVAHYPYWWGRRAAEGYERLMGRANGMFENNKEFFGGLVTSAVIAIAFDFSSRIINCISWTHYMDNSTAIFLAVWLPQLILFFFATLTNIIGHVCVCRRRYRNNYRNGEAEGEARGCCIRCIDFVLLIFGSKIHAALAIHLITFGGVYCFLPLVILTFIYPSRMLVIFTFIPAYFFMTTVIFAIIFKYYTPFLTDQNRRYMYQKLCTFSIAFITICMVMAITYTLVLVILYAVMIGRGSVVSTNTLTNKILSLAPSIFVTLSALFIKRALLGNQDTRNERGGNQLRQL